MKQMPIKNKTFFIFFAIIILLLAGVAYLWQSDFLTKPVILMSPKEEQQWRAEQEQQVATIIKAGNLTSCDDVNYKSADGIDYETVCKNNIARDKALETLDPVWCKKLDNKLFQIADCEREVIFGKLAKEKNIAVCAVAFTPVLKTECENVYWSGQAITENKVTLCANTKNITLENNETINAQTHCEDNFWITKLITEPSKVDCAKLSAEYFQTDCETFQSAKKDTETSRFTVCRRILDPRLQFACERLR